VVRKCEIPGTARAKNYFQDKLAFTTDSVGFQRWAEEGWSWTLWTGVPRRIMRPAIFPERRICLKTNGAMP
jgi:hypothetical protein